MNITYKWAEKLIEFSEEIFEQVSHGKTCDTKVTPYKGPRGKEIGDEEKVKYFGVVISEKL